MNPSRLISSFSLRLQPATVILSIAIGILGAVAAMAETPTPTSTGTPTAAELQKAHDLGTRLAKRDYKEEDSYHTPPTKDLMNYKFADSIKAHGSNLSDLEREVFTEAYWNQFKKDDKDGMTQIDPTTVLTPNTATTTTVTGSSPVKGPGTLQMTDKDGNSYFVDIDQNGNYSITIPQGNFQAVKKTLRTPTLKAAWKRDKDGTWTQTIGTETIGQSVSKSPSFVAMGTGSGAQQLSPAQAVAYLDICKKHVLLSSVDPTPRALPTTKTSQPVLHLVRFFGSGSFQMKPMEPTARFVDDKRSPEEIREARQRGIDHADREYEQSTLKQSLKDRGVSPDEDDRFAEQKRRLDDKKQSAEQGNGPQLTPKEQALLNDMNRFVEVTNMINSYNNATTLLGTDKVTEEAAAARRLQRRAQQMRASGNSNNAIVANALDAQAQALNGGASLPPLRENETGSIQIEGRVVNPSGEPVGWGMASGIILFREENPTSLNNPNLLRDLKNPQDGCNMPLDKIDNDGEFKLKLHYQYPINDKLDLKFNYIPSDSSPPDAPLSNPKAPEPSPSPTAPTEQSMGTGYPGYRTAVGGWDCAYASKDTPLTDAWPAEGIGSPRTLHVGEITFNDQERYDYAFNNYTDPSGINKKDVVDLHTIGDIKGIGYTENPPPHLNISYLEKDVCHSIAPAPSWNPLRWPTQRAPSLPTLHIHGSEFHE